MPRGALSGAQAGSVGIGVARSQPVAARGVTLAHVSIISWRHRVEKNSA